MTVKKQYESIVELLEANKHKKVSTIMPEILELVSGKTNKHTFHKDEEGNVIAIFCYYHKCWELVSEVEYGKKASSAHGLNNMCKEGVSLWTKQQRRAKVAKEELLAKVASGEVEPSALPVELQAIEDERIKIVEQDTRVGFATLDEALACN
jgi:hypothetical protein